jgi:hypothetical protein
VLLERSVGVASQLAALQIGELVPCFGQGKREGGGRGLPLGVAGEGGRVELVLLRLRPA